MIADTMCLPGRTEAKFRRRLGRLGRLQRAVGAELASPAPASWPEQRSLGPRPFFGLLGSAVESETAWQQEDLTTWRKDRETTKTVSRSVRSGLTFNTRGVNFADLTARDLDPEQSGFCEIAAANGRTG